VFHLFFNEKAGCGNIECDKYKECVLNENLEPECECEECDESDPINQKQVCDEMLHIHQTVCEFKDHMCKAGLQYNYTLDPTPCQKKSGGTCYIDINKYSLSLFIYHLREIIYLGYKYNFNFFFFYFSVDTFSRYKEL